jgi:hypothetical protein
LKYLKVRELEIEDLQIVIIIIIEKKWLVSFYIKNKNVYLGRYDTEREALNVADKFRKLHFTPETYI